MIRPVSVRITLPLYEQLHAHLFPPAGGAHGAVIAAGVAETARGTRLLVREIFTARDGVDYVPTTGVRGHHALTAQFVAECSDRCASERLAYLAVHSHGGSHSVAFSPADMTSHERGYPALLDVLEGHPVGALVFASDAVAGDIWSRSGRAELNHMTVVGPRVATLYPGPSARAPHADPIYDRHARFFGDLGQAALRALKVGIIGVGGGGSLLNEWLSRLGVGYIVAIDPQRIDPTNLPRVVGATRWDACTLLTMSSNPLLRRLGQRLARYKVHIARRVARQANPRIQYDAIVGNILDESTARMLADADFVYLASDSIQSRLVFNALVHQYMIPGAQVGVKIRVDDRTGRVTDITVASRPVLPFAGGGCLDCAGWIPASRLTEEALTPDERRAQRYVEGEDVPDPSVITLNVLSAAQVSNDLMMMFTGLYEEGVDLSQQVQFAREREWSQVKEPRADPLCLDCGDSHKSRLARGDSVRLPCRAYPITVRNGFGL